MLEVDCKSLRISLTHQSHYLQGKKLININNVIA